MRKPKFPSERQVAEKLAKVNALLADKKINQKKNFGKKEGLLLCKEMLEQGVDEEYFIADTAEELEAMTDIYRRHIAPVGQLKTVEGKALAIRCVDWLDGVKNEFLA